MPRNRKEPEALAARRRQLAEQERLVAEEMSRLQGSLNPGEETMAEAPRPEPPVWRLEEDGHLAERSVEPTAARRKVLARQKRRDMVISLGWFILLLVVSGICLWLFYTHYESANALPNAP